MIYPEFLKENDTIGVTAPSDGITKPAKIGAFVSATRQLKQLGYFVKETPNVRISIKGRSGTSKERAKQLEDLFLDYSVKVIFCATGGDFLLEMLPEMDFEIIQNNPKWIQGYSDPTWLLFIITTMLDIATIYGSNFGAFGMNPWHSSIKNNLEILRGNIIEQKSFDLYEKEWTESITGEEGYHLTESVYWKNITGEVQVKLKGRMIGGCIDTLSELLGTRFDYVKTFIEKYKNDGIVWYFDHCELSSESLIRVLWRMKDNGWFQYATGIIFGRSGIETSYYDISFEETILHVLRELGVPIITGADIGHVPPRVTIINGAIAEIISENGQGKIQFFLE